ncbi:MAG TPA: ZIP family metal transporter, partial [Gillisia sp.]|nr:ZIP family metal transporter [Gillisia sp.]
MIYILPLLSVLLGYLVALFIKPSTSIAFKLLLSFSGAYLLSVTVFNLLPEVYQSGVSNIGVFIMLGLLVQILLE